jgi:hypothetical protein
MIIQVYSYAMFFYLCFVTLEAALNRNKNSASRLAGLAMLVPIFGRVFGWF